MDVNEKWTPLILSTQEAYLALIKMRDAAFVLGGKKPIQRTCCVCASKEDWPEDMYIEALPNQYWCKTCTKTVLVNESNRRSANFSQLDNMPQNTKQEP